MTLIPVRGIQDLSPCPRRATQAGSHTQLVGAGMGISQVFVKNVILTVAADRHIVEVFMYKKLYKSICLVVFIVALITTQAHALDGEVYFGKMFNSTLAAAPSGDTTAEFIGGIAVGHNFSRFRAFTSIETRMDEYNDGAFHPASVQFESGVSVNLFGDFWLEGSHMCWHPVDKGGAVQQYDMIKASWKFGED